MTYVHTFSRFNLGWDILLTFEKTNQTLIIELFIFKSVLKIQPIPSWNIMQSGTNLLLVKFVYFGHKI